MSSIIVNPTNVTIDGADLQISSGNFILPPCSSTTGCITINGTNLVSTYSNNMVSGFYNTFVGPNSGNLTMNTNFCGGNSGFGELSLSSLTTGAGSVAVGTQAGKSITTGSRSVFLGYSAGLNYTSSESDNILIGYNITGTVNESHVTRIGISGSGSGQQSKCFIGGIDGVNVGSVAKVLTMASDQVGTATITAGAGISIATSANAITISSSALGTTTHALQIGNVSGTLSSLSVGSNGQIPIGASGSDPVMATITAGSGISVTNGSGSITIASTASTGIATLTAQTGSATGSSVLIYGGSNITTSATGSTVTVDVSSIWGRTVGLSGLPVVVNSGNTMGTVLSSLRFKENVQPMADLSSRIMDLEPVVFNIKGESSQGLSFGLIAEDVEKIMPELVVLDENLQPYSVKYHELPAMLLNEIKKLKDEIADLRSSIKGS